MRSFVVRRERQAARATARESGLGIMAVESRPQGNSNSGDCSTALAQVLTAGLLRDVRQAQREEASLPPSGPRASTPDPPPADDAAIASTVNTLLALLPLSDATPTRDKAPSSRSATSAAMLASVRQAHATHRPITRHPVTASVSAAGA